MYSFLDEIRKNRTHKTMDLDLKNTNRYRLIFNEKDGSKTAYYFNTPIYNIKTGKIVTPFFEKEGTKIKYTGSNADVVFSDKISMRNGEGECIIDLGDCSEFVSDTQLRCGKGVITPTVNGFLCKYDIEKTKDLCFTIKTSKPFAEVKENGKCFSIMIDNHRPFVTLSCIGIANEHGSVESPLEVICDKKNDETYGLSFKYDEGAKGSLLFEINMYENKLVQDTTVESANPLQNNVFGGISFLGSTDKYGEQYLYLKLDHSRMNDLYDKQILIAKLHIPILGGNAFNVTAHKVSSRFCSFGSTWESKIPTTH